MRNLCIPTAVQIHLDDVGWWCGRDDRSIKGPSRSGATRFHVPADYQAIEQLGKAIGQKITCGMVLGEWDMENALGKAIVNFSHFGDQWNNAAFRDANQLREAADIMNASEHIDFALHGLYHGYYNGLPFNPDISDYYYKTDEGLFAIPDEEIRNRLYWFFALMDKHGIKKEVTTFIPPCFNYRDHQLSYILKDYGIRYIGTIFDQVLKDGANRPELICDDVYFEEDIITVNRRGVGTPWDQMDASLEGCPLVDGILGLHWVNILNPDPEENSETLKKFIPYFEKCRETFGFMVSKDMAFCATQKVYRKYSKVIEEENRSVLDISEVPDAKFMLDSFFISAQKPVAAFEGCRLLSIEKHEEFFNYQIQPTDKVIKFRY